MATCTEASRWAHGFGGAAKKLSLTLAPFWGCVKPAPMSTMGFCFGTVFVFDTSSVTDSDIPR